MRREREDKPKQTRETGKEVENEDGKETDYKTQFIQFTPDIRTH
jgi:hypothetical protein